LLEGVGWSPSSVQSSDGASRLILFWEHIFQSHLQPAQDRLQLIQREMVLASFNAMERGMRHANLLREIRIGQATTRLSQKTRKLSVEVSLHPAKLAK